MKNAWIDEVRSRTVRDRVLAPEESGLNVGTGGAGQMDAYMEAQAARAAMESLPEEQRLVLSLVLIEGFSYREAAEMLDLPIGTVTSRLARGRAAIEARLGGRAEEA